MNANVGNFDSSLRIAFGTAFMVTAGLYGSGWALIGVAVLASGFLHWCPLYAPLRVATRDCSSPQ